MGQKEKENLQRATVELREAWKELGEAIMETPAMRLYMRFIYWIFGISREK